MEKRLITQVEKTAVRKNTSIEERSLIARRHNYSYSTVDQFLNGTVMLNGRTIKVLKALLKKAFVNSKLETKRIEKCIIDLNK